METVKPIVIFDGMCPFCSGVVRIVLSLNSQKVFHFLPGQSEEAKQVLETYRINYQKTDSIILLHRGKIYMRGEAVLGVLRLQNGFALLFYYIFKMLPLKLINWIYDIFAANRYFIFGKRKQCFLPSVSKVIQ